jgi:hypothetical protein
MNTSVAEHAVYAGPVLRCAAGSRVIIWMALSTNMDFSIVFSLRVWDRRLNRWAFRQLEARAFGESSFEISERMTIVEKEYEIIWNKETSELEATLSYSAVSTDKKSEAALFSRFVLLSDYEDRWISLTSSLGRKPKKPRPKVVMAASCRNMADSRQDAISGLISGVRRRHAECDVECLFLLGDQIYADETGNFLTLITETAEKLFGGYKPFPQRKQLSKKIQLTTEAPEQQLLNFPEYASCYLLHLSTALWPQRLFVQSSNMQKRKEEVGLWEKVLSQVPCLSIFDDHDVTDDWFFDEQWRARILRHPEGKELVASALMAFLLFQARHGFSAVNTSLVEKLTSKLKSSKYSCANDINALLDLEWSFAGVSGSTFIALDTRTKRGMDKRYAQIFKIDDMGKRTMPLPQMKRLMLSPEHLQRSLLKSIESKDTLFIYTATPVFGMPGFEMALDWLPDLSVISTFSDKEYFSCFPLSWSYLAQAITKHRSFKNIVIISGDVHYSFLAEAEFEVDGETTRCMQITTSPVCNTAIIQPNIGAMGNSWIVEALHFGLDNIVDFFPATRESTQTRSLIKSLQKKPGSLVSRRWRIIGRTSTSPARPYYESAYAEVCIGGGHIRVSLRDSTDSELIGRTL